MHKNTVFSEGGFPEFVAVDLGLTEGAPPDQVRVTHSIRVDLLAEVERVAELTSSSRSLVISLIIQHYFDSAKFHFQHRTQIEQELTKEAE